MLSYLFLLFQRIAPHHTLSRLVGYCSRSRNKTIKTLGINHILKRYRVEMDDAVQPDPHAYESFNAFFTRVLKPESRPIAAAENAIASPVDGTISQLGQVDNDLLLQAKGLEYSLPDLFGGYEQHSEMFRNGHFITMYLAPNNYHRVHIPVTGTLLEMLHIPGRVFFSESPYHGKHSWFICT